MSAIASIIFNQIRRIDEKVLTQSEDWSDGNDNEERSIYSYITGRIGNKGNLLTKKNIKLAIIE